MDMTNAAAAMNTSLPTSQQRTTLDIPRQQSTVLTRSMLRKSLDPSSSLPIRHALSPRPINRLPGSTATSDKLLVTKAGRAHLAPDSTKSIRTAPKRKSLAPSSQSVRGQALRTFGKPSSQVAGLRGMGVRTGPPVLGQRSPTKVDASKENDPFKLRLQPALPTISPIRQQQQQRPLSPMRTDVLTSPVRAMSPNQQTTLSFGHSPSRMLHFDGSSPTQASKVPSSPVLPTSKKHFVDSSDDDFDVDSPRKKQRQSGFGFSPTRGPLPSISQRLNTDHSSPASKSSAHHGNAVSAHAGPVVFDSAMPPSGEGLGPVSVPMSRARHSYANFNASNLSALQRPAPATASAPPIPQSGTRTTLQQTVEPQVDPLEEDDDDGDISMANTTLSEDAAKRLTDLQAMLNRLAKPRHSIATTRPSASTSILAPVTNGRPLRPTSSAPAVPKMPSLAPSAADVRHSRQSMNARRSLVAPTLASSQKAKPAVRRTDMTDSALMPPPADRPARRVSALPPPPRAFSGVQTIQANAPKASSTAKAQCLRGVTAYVDVRTQEGDDAGMMFVDMLKSMGARVLTRPTLTLTHIIFKSGRPGTIQHYRAHPEPKPHVVGIAWVVRCAELEQRANEKPYRVEMGHEPVVPKRRRTMEPKAYRQVDVNKSIGEADPSMHETIAASIERARRKSLQYAPKVASPLRKRVWTASAPEEQNGEDEEDDSLPESLDAMMLNARQTTESQQQ